MKNAFFLAIFGTIFFVSCTQDLESPAGATNEVSITTESLTSITSTSAQFDATIVSDGGNAITQRGVVVSTYTNPTVADTKITKGAGVGRYTDTIGGLKPNTAYYLRAYAINSLGTVYGSQRTFTTLIMTPVLTNPAQGVQVPCCSVSFQWSSIPGVTQYELNIARNSSFTGSVYAISTCTGTTSLQYNYLNVATASTASFCVRTGTAINNGTWYWRVRAKYSNGYSNWSTMRSFNYVY